MKRVVDVLLAVIAIPILLLPFIALALLVRFTSGGPILYWSERIGRKNSVFRMPKFRTMRVETPIVATHLLRNSNLHVTRVGGFLRRTSLDEIPQIWNIFVGDMSFVGPRPALFNQSDLIALRTKAGVDILVPGLTGWAQVNGRDMLSIEDKVKLDMEYLKRRSMRFDLKILWLTLLRIGRWSDVSH
jgi:O-antigen biosynthesis protein WbqP